jgi:hypothetical protein
MVSGDEQEARGYGAERMQQEGPRTGPEQLADVGASLCEPTKHYVPGSRRWVVGHQDLLSSEATG